MNFKCVNILVRWSVAILDMAEMSPGWMLVQYKQLNSQSVVFPFLLLFFYRFLFALSMLSKLNCILQ